MDCSAIEVVVVVAVVVVEEEEEEVCLFWNRDSVMNMAVRLRAEKCGVRISAGERDFNPLQTVQATSRVKPISYSVSAGVLSGDKATGA